jgi:hypothetical protein
MVRSPWRSSRNASPVEAESSMAISRRLEILGPGFS